METLNQISNGELNWIVNKKKRKNSDADDNARVRKMALIYTGLWCCNCACSDLGVSGDSNGLVS